MLQNHEFYSFLKLCIYVSKWKKMQQKRAVCSNLCVCKGEVYSKGPHFDTQLYVQLWTFAYVWLLNSPYENEVTSKEHN